jgi:hypothetical protein
MSWSFYAISGTLVSLLAWTLERRRWKTWNRTLGVAILFIVLGLVVFKQLGPATLGNEKWYEATPYVEGLFFGLMLLGMIARYLTKAIEYRREKIDDLRKAGGKIVKPPLEFDLWEFSYPLFISIVTFGALLSQLVDRRLSIANAVLSFQTGFFWQTLLAAKQSDKN